MTVKDGEECLVCTNCFAEDYLCGEGKKTEATLSCEFCSSASPAITVEGLAAWGDGAFETLEKGMDRRAARDDRLCGRTADGVGGAGPDRRRARSARASGWSSTIAIRTRQASTSIQAHIESGHCCVNPSSLAVLFS